eukprot:2834071-Pyramimonas_sp.AAC.1
MRRPIARGESAPGGEFDEQRGGEHHESPGGGECDGAGYEPCRHRLDGQCDDARAHGGARDKADRAGQPVLALL